MCDGFLFFQAFFGHDEMGEDDYLFMNTTPFLFFPSGVGEGKNQKTHFKVVKGTQKWSS